MVNIYDDIHALVDTFKQTEQLKAFESAALAVKEDETAMGIYLELRGIMTLLHDKQMQGQEVEEAEYQRYEVATQAAQGNELVNGMLQAEQGVGMMMEEVTKELLKPVQGIYEQLG